MEKNEKKVKYGIVAMDVIIFVVVLIISLCFAFNAFDSLKPFHRGFFCDDQTLKYPYKDDTISSTLLAALAIILFPLLVVLLHILNAVLSKGTFRSYFNARVGISCYSTIGIYLFGGVLSQLVVEIIKLFVGRLRPHFFDGCKPSYGLGENCTSEGYILDYECTNTDSDITKDVRKSFPSGHASAATYLALYMVIYLDLKLRRQFEACRLLCPLIQITIIVSALYVCISRLQDNKHHPTDVIAGSVVGIIGCLVTVIFLSSLPKEHKIDMDKRNIDSEAEKPITNGMNSTRVDSKESIDGSHRNKGFCAVEMEQPSPSLYKRETFNSEMAMNQHF